MENLKSDHQQSGRNSGSSLSSPGSLSKWAASNLLSALVLAAVCGPLFTLAAADFVVSNTLDSGPGSLRNAISNATVRAGPDTITCTNVSGTIFLGSLLPILPDQTTILGPGAERLVVSGSNSFRVFQVDSGASVSISGITIANGYVTNQGGAGILNFGSLTLSNVAVVQNQSLSAPGGGILNQGTLKMVSSTIASNLAGALPLLGFSYVNFEVRGLGGGIYVNGGSVSISNSWVTANQAVGGLTYGSGFPTSGEGSGGGIYIQAGPVSIASSTFSDNLARGGYGGMDPISGVHGSSGAQGFGGAVFLNAGGNAQLTLINATISGNKAEGGAGGGAFKYGGNGGNGFGGGIYAAGSNCILVNCTVYQNTPLGGAGGAGGIEPPQGPGSPGSGSGNGIYIREAGPTFLNSIVQASVGTLNSRGFNIFEGGSNIRGAIPSDITNIVITLDPLADNGGPTLTHALPTNSPAVDAGTSPGAPDFDQRGLQRLKGSSVDIGAFESSFQGSSAFITGQPQDLSLLTGATAVFSVAARGTKPHYFQWQFNETDIARATNSSLAITNLQLADIGHYSVTVSNPFGSETSRAAKLDITPDTPLNNWSVRQDSKTYQLEAVTYGDGLWVTVGYAYAPSSSRGIILTSPDGVSWSERFSKTGYYFGDVTFGNGIFVAVSGVESTSCRCPGIVYSSNGIEWIEISIDALPVADPLYVAGYGGGKFIVAGGTYSGSSFDGWILSSIDPQTWSGQNIGNTWLRDFAYGDGAYILVGSSVQGTGRTLRSTNGSSWQQFDLPNPDQSYRSIKTVIHAGRQFVALQYVSTPYGTEVLTSQAGTDWIRHTHVPYI
ncbi:MAG: hypothetical protein IPK15_20255 [Verrucomicrobia bacterium]|nr:hypothetical protein [Verrucomicrobiota bacterium]